MAERKEFAFIFMGVFLNDGAGRIAWLRIIAKNMKGRNG
jgi:hypothetical protein